MAVSFLEEKGADFEIVKYLEELPTKEEFKLILAKLDIPAESLVRKSEPYFKSNLKGLNLSEEEWIDTMLENPKLIERPIVVKNNRAVVARPAEKILEIL